MARQRKKRKKAPGSINFTFLILALSILSYGIIMVLSAGSTAVTAEEPFSYVIQQLKWAVFGLVAGGIAMVVPYTFWRKFAGIGVGIAIILLGAVLFSDADPVKGAARWLYIGSFSIQPSELAKPAIVLFLAHILDRYSVRTWRNLLVPILGLAPVLLLVLKQPDLGTAIVIMMTAAAMFLQTQLPMRYFMGGIPVLGGLGYLYVRSHSYQMDRIKAWLDPWQYAKEGYQSVNAQIAFGTGGIFGAGLGRSLQKDGFLPENHTDTIFAVIGEELGLIGATTLLVLYVLLFWQGYKIAYNCPDRFGKFLAYGLISSIAIQTAVNLAVVTGVMPVTGITLPLVSYGGNSLLVTMIMIGMILNISRYQKEKIKATDSPQAVHG